MNIRASGRSALIIAAGLWLGFAGPLRANDSAGQPASQAAQTETAGTPVKLSKFSKHRPRHVAHVVHSRKSAKTASKAAAKTDKTAAVSVPQDSNKLLPPAVANANALMPGVTDTPKTEADALASSAGKTLAASQATSQAASQTNAAQQQPQADAAPAPTAATDPATAAAADVVPSDELNDVDRALAENKQATPEAATPTLAMASIDSPASATSAGTTTGQSATNEDSAWNQTSLIGKIFIAFGGFLTLASAARMFIA
ncbi:MAG: hypothetical protein JSS22_06370 [Proteobacteria bacterium]|nr:hypothetical protein [Pseudomonadota bacterium]